jgi:carbonic anhydrase
MKEFAKKSIMFHSKNTKILSITNQKYYLKNIFISSKKLFSSKKDNNNTKSSTSEQDNDSKHGVCPAGCTLHNHKLEASYNRLIEGNKKYVLEKTMNNPNYFKDRAQIQAPKYLLIGCSDSRVPPNEMTMTEPGEIFIHRNIANQVIFSDLNCMSVLQFGIEHLKVQHVIVLGHTKCGGIIASKNKEYKGIIENWLQNIRDIAFMNKEELDKCKTEEDYFKKLTIFNVRSQVLNVCKTPYVQKAWANNQNLHVHGWLVDIETGLINDLGVTNKDWNKIKESYEFDFKLI